MDSDYLIDELEAKVAAMEREVDNIGVEAEDREIKSKKAMLLTAMEHMSDNSKEDLKRTVRNGDDPLARKAMDEIDEEEDDNRAKRRKHSKVIDEDEPEMPSPKGKDQDKKRMEAKIHAMSARLREYEDERKQGLIDDLVSLKSSLVQGLDEDTYREKLGGMSFDYLKDIHDERKDEMAALKAAKRSPTVRSFGFNVESLGTMTNMKDILAGAHS